MTKRKLLTGLVLAGLLTAGFGSSVLPASATDCTVTATLVGGQQVSFQVPPGTPVSAVALPAGATGVSESCPPPASSAPTTTTAPSSPTPNPPPQPTPRPKGPATVFTGQPGAPSSGKAQKTTGTQQTKPQANTQGAGGGAKTAPVPSPTVPAPLPGPSNPTFSFALPNPAALGVPDFFIQKFRVPLFLLPIYQAAGTEYGVPWQILAAINEIETDYGRDLSVSSANAEGWMQFLPSTWAIYGVDANQDGKKDPYNPADAIFAAARYLKAAGAQKDLRGSIFAYNHATWYVDSVILRAKLIGGMPDRLIGSLTGLTQGHFPVPAKATYADDALTAAKPAAGKPKPPLGVNIFAKAGAPVIAVQDGKITRVGVSKTLGNYIQLQDAYGNIYTYSGLRNVSSTYPVPKPQVTTSSQVAKQLHISQASATTDPAPSVPATAGHQPALPATTAPAAAPQAPAPSAAFADGATKERLFASPARPAAYTAGGRAQIQTQGQTLPSTESLSSYFTQVFGLGHADVLLKPLRTGSAVIAGTILGRIGQVTPGVSPHVLFQVRPAGHGAPLVDPKPVLDGWKLLESTAIYRAANQNPFLGANAKNPTIGQVLLMSKEALQQRVLADPSISIYSCGRLDIAGGAIDRRILGTLEFLAASGLRPTVSALKCGPSASTPTALTPAAAADATQRASGNGVDIAAVNGIPILGHQGPGSIADITIRQLLTLQGIFKPQQIISLMTYPGTDNTQAMPDHNNRVHVGFEPLYSTDPKLAGQINSVLQPNQWIKLIDRLRQIQNPVVSPTPSKAAIGG
jgi:hypothetical protein